MNKLIVIALIVLTVVGLGVYFHYVPLSTGCSCNGCQEAVVVEEVVVAEEPVVEAEAVEEAFEKAVATEAVANEAAKDENHGACRCCRAHAEEKNEK